MNTMKKSFSVFAVLLAAVIFLAAALVACAPEPAKDPPRIAANQISIFLVDASGALSAVTPSDFEGLNAGDTKMLSAEVSPADATDKAVTWSSSDASIVAIDAAGTLTAQASGNATITATASSGAAAMLSVSVAYSITDEAGLRAMANNLAGYYVLKGDITLTNEWTPLGTFTGTLDGAGYSVKNLQINAPSILNTATGFITENRGTVKNIGVELGSQNVTGGDAFGALVGRNRGAVSGRVTGAGKVVGKGGYTGGLVGVNYGTIIGYATVAVEGQGTSGTGGLVGSNEGTVVGYVSGAVTGAVAVGGLVGTVNSGTVIGYATGAVAGMHSDAGRNVNQIGGLIGDLGGSIYGYARGAVSTDRVVPTGTNIGPAAGRGDGSASGGAANIYYSGKSGESTVTGPAGVTANTFGNKVTVTTSTAQSAFPNLTFGSDVGEWTFYTGKWPAINFPADQSIFDSVRGDKQPIAP